jgi:hypothetical protein
MKVLAIVKTIWLTIYVCYPGYTSVTLCYVYDLKHDVQ